MSTPPRKGQSRPATPRPRKLAGRRPDVEPEVEPAPAAELTEEPAVDAVVEEPPADPPVVEAEPVPASRPPRGRTTWILVAVIAILAVVGVGEVVYLVRDPDPTVSAARPVVTGDLSHRAAVEAAASSTEQILSTSYQDFDGQVDKAAALTTGAFTEDYRKLQEGLKADFIAQRTKLRVEAVAQGVVQASPEQVQALLFLNQYVEKEQNGKPTTSYAQYRALVTVVHTDQGWLVSNIETK